MIPIVIGALGTISKEFIKGQGDLEIRVQVKTVQAIALFRSARILKSPGDLRRLAVTQTSV